MSGGSFNYLCSKDEEQLLGAEADRDLRDMADFLASLGYAEDAAQETEELLVLARQARVRLAVRVRRLAGVWKAAEWWQSMDSSEDDLREALAVYRESRLPQPGQQV